MQRVLRNKTPKSSQTIHNYFSTPHQKTPLQPYQQALQIEFSCFILINSAKKALYFAHDAQKKPLIAFANRSLQTR